MTRALRELLASETHRLQDAGLYKREVIFTPGGGMAAGGMVEGRSDQLGGRGPNSPAGQLINYTTHDYLGLSRDGEVRAAAVDAVNSYGIGLSSQRVMCGTLRIHKDLEEQIAGFLKLPDAILYGSAYHANIGLFSPLFGKRDCIICDAGIHPSLADGVRLAGSRLLTYRNNDPEDLEDILRRSKWARFRAIVTNGVFPFSGRVADLDSICALADKYDALVVVDDCLGIGALGERGRGTTELMSALDRIDIVTGSFSKALGGACGGFAAGRTEIIEWLRQKSPPYMFSAALPPGMAGAAMRSLEILESGNAPLPGLRDNINKLWHGLLEREFRVLGGHHPLLAVEVGSFAMLQQMVNLLYEGGIYVHGLCYPVVPENEARIRMMVSSLHSEEHLERTLDAMVAARDGKVLSARPPSEPPEPEPASEPHPDADADADSDSDDDADADTDDQAKDDADHDAEDDDPWR
jgi:glycine C-acetyltransferase